MQTYTVRRTINLEQWFLNDQLHNEFGPAEIFYYSESGALEEENYYLKGLFHRTGGAARIWYRENGSIESEAHFINGKLHRTDGPAFIIYDENLNVEEEQYYLNGKQLNKEELLSKTQQSCDGKIIEIEGKQYKLTEI